MLPARTATTTNASQPQIAVLRWLALQCPMREAKLLPPWGASSFVRVFTGSPCRLRNAAGATGRSGGGRCEFPLPDPQWERPYREVLSSLVLRPGGRVHTP